MDSKTMRADQRVTATGHPKTDSEDPGQIIGLNGDWSTDRPDLITITPSTDSISAVIAGKGTPGTAIVTLNAQATGFTDSPPNLRAIGTFEVILTALPATHFVFSFSTPV